jgi:all-trans-8'-apo-beta-carotenal 15,15'-oxygenase
MNKPAFSGGAPISFMEFDRSWRMVQSIDWHLAEPNSIVHDVALSENYYAVMQWASTRIGTLLWGARPFIEALAYDPDKTPKLYLFPRQPAGGREPLVIPLPRTFMFHLFNMHEQGDDVVLYTTGYQDAVKFNDSYPPALRKRIGLQSPPPNPPAVHRIVANTAQVTRYPEARFEAPAINPERQGREARWGYAAADISIGEDSSLGYFAYHGVGKVDLESGAVTAWDAGPRAFTSPPQFIPRVGATAEDDGYLLTWVFDASNDRTDVVILDARDLSRAPLARLKLKHWLPAVSHTEFSGEVLLA